MKIKDIFVFVAYVCIFIFLIFSVISSYFNNNTFSNINLPVITTTTTTTIVIASTIELIIKKSWVRWNKHTNTWIQIRIRNEIINTNSRQVAKIFLMMMMTTIFIRKSKVKSGRWHNSWLLDVKQVYHIATWPNLLKSFKEIKFLKKKIHL